MTERKLLIVFVLFLAAWILPFCTSQSGICYVRTSSRQRSVNYRRGSYTVGYGCGLWGWGRCTRTVYTSTSRASYYTTYMRQSRCCSGYSGSSCTPVCSSGCSNGGRCVSPNTCSCSSGWTGRSCRQDINECNGRNNCGTVAYTMCQNTPGGYLCPCIFGRSTARPCAVPPNPMPPTNLHVSTLGSKTATISWRAPTMQTNNRVTGYTLTIDEQKFNIPDASVSISSSRLSYVYSGLQEFDNYQVQIKSVSIFGFSSSSASISFTTLEAAPTSPPRSLSGSNQSPTVISLSWSPPPTISVNGDLDHYVIELAEMVTDRQFQNTATSTEITVRSLHPYYVYKCRVAAFTNARGPYTEYINVRTSESAPTAPPSSIQTDTTATSLTLRWNPPPSDYQNGIIQHYLVHLLEYETKTSYEQQSSQNRITFNSLHPFYTYKFNISAVTVAAGPFSTEMAVKLPEAAPSSPPQSVNGSSINSTTITIEWVPPPIEARNGIIRQYLISIAEIESGRDFQRSSLVLSVTIGSLHPDYTYECRVTAVTVSEGPYSVVFTVRTPIAAPSSPPSNIDPRSRGPRTLLVTWDPPPPENRNGAIVGYLVNITTKSFDFTLPQLFVSNTSLTQKFLKPFTMYVIYIAAMTAAGSGPFSRGIMITTPEDVPSNPTDPFASKVIGIPSQLLISWHPPLEPNGVLTYYSIYCRESNPDAIHDSNEMKEVLEAGENTTALIFPGLKPYTYYKCYMSCNTSIGEGNTSSAVLARTDESTPDDAPQFISTHSNFSSSIRLEWKEPLFPNGVIVSYSLTYNFTERNATIVVNSTSYNIQNLVPFTYYKIILYSSTRIGDGPYSFVTVRTAESSPDAPPQNLYASVLSYTEVFTSWIPPKLDKRNGIISHYRVVLNDDQFNVSGTILNVTTEEHTFGDLEEFARYSCKVAAATSAGLGPFSELIHFTTFESAPSAPPQSLRGVFHSSTVIMVSWSPPPPLDVNGVVQYYIAKVTERFTGRTWTFFAVDSTIHIGSLHPYYLYDCIVAAHTIAVGPYTNVLTIQTDEEAPTAPPTGVSASATSHTIQLIWSPPALEHANGFIKYYSVKVVELESQQEFIHFSNDSDYTIDSLHPHYSYVCSVAAYTVGIGPYSDSVTIQLDESSPSGMPVNVTGYPTGSDSITISWEPPILELQNGVIRYYIISMVEIETGTVFNHTSIGAELTVFSLHPYYCYDVVVSAVTVGSGPFSTVVTVQTEQDVPSAPVQNLFTVALSFDEISLSWEPPPTQDQNGIVIGYKVNVTNVYSRIVMELTSFSANLTVQALRAFTAYECRVAPFTKIGVGPYSEIVSVTTDQTAPSSSPFNLTASVIKSTEFKLSWSPPLPETHNGVITKYVILVTEMLTDSVMPFTSQTTSIVVQSLHPYYNYECTVSAFTVSEGPFSYILTVQTLQDVPNGYPRNATVTNITSKTATIVWEPPADNQKNGIISSYIVNLTEAESRRVVQLNTTINSLTLTALDTFSTYFVAISASTVVGQGPFSTSYTLSTLEDAPTSPPLHLSSRPVDSTTIHLSWNPPNLSERNGIIREYRIELAELETMIVSWHVSFGTSLVISSLHPDYTYEWSATAFTVAEGPYSNTDNITTPEDVPSGSPVSIKVKDVNSSMFTLQWDPPIIEHRNGDIIGYTVSVSNIESEEEVQTELTSHSNLLVTDLKPHTVYDVVIAAMTAVGNGPYSPVVLVQTLEDAPSSHPANLTGYALNSTHIYLNWDSPPDDQINGILRQYKINVTEDKTGKTFQFTSAPESTEKAIGPFHPFYTYHCTVVAYTIKEGPHTDVIAIKTREDVPTSGPVNVSVTILESMSLTIDWEPPPIEQQNGILRSYVVTLFSSSGNITLSVSAERLAINVTGLRPYTSYVCSVHAVTVGIGPPTQSIGVTYEDVPVSPPHEVRIKAVDPTTLFVHWSPPDDHPNGILRRYVLNITEVETGLCEQFFTKNTSITVTSRHPFYHYSCIVSAETVGLGPFSFPVIVLQPEAGPTLPPSEVAYVSTTSTSILFVWKNPIAISLNGVLRGYSIILTEENTGKSLQTTTKLPQRVFEVLHPYYNYTLKVAAVTVAPGPFSDPFTVTTLEDFPTGAPTNVQIKTRSSRSLQLSWDTPSMRYSNGLITMYTVRVVDEFLSVRELSTPDKELELEDLKPHTMYYCTVTAVNSVGQGPHSSPVAISTLEAAPDSPPDNIVSLNVSSTTVTLSWVAPVEELVNGVIRHYTILINETNTGSISVVNTTSHPLHIVGDLHPFYTYQFSVQAVTVAPGPLSTPLTVTTQEDVPTGSPQNVGGLPTDSKSLLLQWNPPPFDSQNGVIVHYLVNVTVIESGHVFQLRPNDTFIGVKSLHPFYSYRFTIASVTNSGVGPFSEGYYIQMPEDLPTSYPLNFTGDSNNSTSILLEWQLPGQESRNGLITSYTILVREILSNRSLTFVVDGKLHVLITSLHPYYHYECRIAANTSVGRGPFSDPVIVTTLEDAPSAPPADVIVVYKNSSSIEVAWNEPAPQNQNGRVQYFVLNITNLVDSMSSLHNITSSCFPITNLHPYYTYSLSVAAVTVSVGPFSEEIRVTTLQDVPSGTPMNVTATAVSPTSLNVSWLPPELSKRNGIVSGFEVSLTHLLSETHNTYSLSESTLFFHQQDLRIFADYQVRVAAKTAVGTGPFSIPVAVQTWESLPGPPSRLSIKTYNSTIVRLEWQEPDHTNGIILGYQVIYVGFRNDSDSIKINTIDGPHVINLEAMETSAVIDGLHYDLSYDYTVRAQTKVGYGSNNTVTVIFKRGAQSSISQTSSTTVLLVVVVFLLLGVGIVLGILLALFKHKDKIKSALALNGTLANVPVENTDAHPPTKDAEDNVKFTTSTMTCISKCCHKGNK